MCNQPNCLHKDHINLNDRDIRVAKALISTLFMRMFAAHEHAQDAMEWAMQAGACSIDCNNPECGHNRTLEECLRHAVDHVDNGEELIATAMYDDIGLLQNGKQPVLLRAASSQEEARALFASVVRAFSPQPSRMDADIFVDNIVIDPPPVAIEIGPTPSAKIELGRMVGPDRGRMSDLIDFFGEGDEGKLPN